MSTPPGGGLPPELDPRRAKNARGRSGSSSAPARVSPPAVTGATATSPSAHRDTGGAGRFFSAIAAIVAVLILVGSGTSWAVFRHFNNNITREDVFADVGDDRPPAAPNSGQALNVLLVGSDTREGAGDEDFQGSGSEEVIGARSDTTILLHLNKNHDKAMLVSIPRDSYVDIPSCVTTDSGTSEATKNKFNSAFSTGGAACTIKTVEANTGIRIDHYIQVDFAGFQDMVDAIGGVQLCLPAAVQDEMSGLDLPSGPQTVQGTQALAYVRARYNLGDGSDLGRIQRQQQFLAAMVRQVSSAEVLLHPKKLLDFLTAVTDSVTADQDLSFNDMKDIAFSLRGLDPAHVAFVTVPLSDTNYNVEGVGSTVLWAQPQADELWQTIRDDDILPSSPDDTTPSAPAEPITVPPHRIRVNVLNGSSLEGAATAAANDLRRVGFLIGKIGDADRQDYEKSVVRHGPNRNESATTVAAAVPGSVKQADAQAGSTVTLIVGDNYTESVGVTVTPATPEPGASGTPSLTANQDPCADQ